jgi:hypothetical protein
MSDLDETAVVKTYEYMAPVVVARYSDHRRILGVRAAHSRDHHLEVTSAIGPGTPSSQEATSFRQRRARKRNKDRSGRFAAGAAAHPAVGDRFATRVSSSYLATDSPSWRVTSASQRTSP